MKLRALLCVCMIVAVASICRAQAASDASCNGVWRAEADGLPYVTLTVTEESGHLSGAILFYLHQRKTANDPYTSTAGIPEPLLNPSFDGQTLTFQVSHRRAHPPGSLSDPPVTFRLKLTGASAAGLTRGELSSEAEHSPGLPMIRSIY